MSIIIAIIALGLIITIHEFGHFMLAKIFNVPVREFSVGMGPRIISKIYKNTRYSLKAFPFGGSCAMIGEDPAGSGDFSNEDFSELEGIADAKVIDEIRGYKIDDEGKMDFDGVKFTREFIDKNNFSVIAPWKKFLICLAGPFANFILAFLLAIIIVAKVGFDIPIVSNISENGAASEALPIAIESNDKIVALEIPGCKWDIGSYRELALFMQLNNDTILKYKYPLAVSFIRSNEDKVLKTVLYPKYDETYNKAMIGVSFESVYKMPKSFIETIDFATREFMFYISTTIKSLRLLIGGKLKASDISGPVGTVAVMGEAINEAKSIDIISAIYTIFTLMVLISANLGVMNLLPIPALDGGRIVFAAIEMIIGKKLNKEIEATANTITMILLLGFMVFIFGMDIYKLMGK